MFPKFRHQQITSTKMVLTSEKREEDVLSFECKSSIFIHLMSFTLEVKASSSSSSHVAREVGMLQPRLVLIHHARLFLSFPLDICIHLGITCFLIFLHHLHHPFFPLPFCWSGVAHSNTRDSNALFHQSIAHSSLTKCALVHKVIDK